MPRADWDCQALFMREHHATHAKWTAQGQLTALTLGPEPAHHDIQNEAPIPALEVVKRPTPGLVPRERRSDSD